MTSHRPPLPCLLLGLALPACGTFGLDQRKDTGADTGAAEAGLRIDRLSPDWAPLAGGTDITVHGNGFTGDAVFWFGGAPVDTTVVDDQTLVVTSPQVQVSATVDVKVVAGEDEVTLRDAFTFADEDPTPGDDTGGGDGGGDDGGDDGGDVDGVTAVVEMDYIAVPCMDCFGVTSQVFVEAVAMFHDPTSGTWTGGLPPNGTCTTTPSSTTPVGSTRDVGASVTLQTGGSAYALSRTSAGGLTAYQSSGMGQNDYARNASWDLLLSGGPWGAVTLPGALRTTSGFSDIQPIDIFEADSWYAFAPVYTSSFQMTWSPSGVSDSVVVDIQVYDSITGQAYPNGNIVCAAADAGAITIPASYFSSFYQGDLASVFLYRWDTNTSSNPVDGSTIEGMTLFGALGTATLY